MLNRFLCFSALSLCAVSPFSLVVSVAQAQECKAPYEMVTALFHPDPGSPSVWDALYGEAGSAEEFASVVPLAGGGVLAAGEYRKTEADKPALVLAEIDRRGKKLWDRTYNVKNMHGVVRILPHEGGYVVLANRRDENAKTFWLGFFNAAGDLKTQKEFSEKQMSLSANDIVHQADGKKFVVAVTTEDDVGQNKKSVRPKQGGIYILDTNGTLITKRSYDLADESEILGLSVSEFEGEKTGYIATGYFKNSFGKKTGWVLRLEEDGGLVWQREFDRGLASRINFSSKYDKKSVLAFGDVVPADSGPIGSWLMMLDSSTGDVLWQRYFSAGESAHDYFASGLLVNGNGVIIPAMTAKARPQKKVQKPLADVAVEDKAAKDAGMIGDHAIPENVDYAHLLALSPRGITLSGDSYFAGKGAQVRQAVLGTKGERIITGAAIVPNGDAFEAIKQEAEKAETLKQEEIAPAKLPQAELSEKTQKGLELLKQKIGTKADNQKRIILDESKSAKIGDLAKEQVKTSKNGWILAGEALDAYSDPCK